MSENKTVGDGIDKALGLIGDVGSGLSRTAQILIEKGEELIRALGDKASEAIGPATGIAGRLFDQYVDDRKEYAKLLRASSIKFIASGAALGIL
jgi:hypothetical protein